MIELWGVFAASVIGSWHCAGMCGPFAAFLVKEKSSSLPIIFYHIGRLCTYLALASLAFLIGTPLRNPVGQKVLLGILVLWSLVLLFNLNILRVKIPGVLVNLNRKMMPKKGALTGFVLGMTTTLLPCGWLYGFLLLAAGRPHLPDALVFMTAFWVGTIPALLASQTVFKKAFSWMGMKSQRISALILILFALGGLALHSPFKEESPCSFHHTR